MLEAASPEGPHGDEIAVGLMCKALRPSITKTRLAATIGAELAAARSECFLRDVAELIARIESSHRLQGYGLYAPADAASEIETLLPASFRLTPQQGNDFSSVVHGAIAGLLERHPAGAILINADSPTLLVAVLAQAAGLLRQSGDRLVLGPALDGGYYLIGLKTAHWDLFRDMPWSTPEVGRITIDRARAIGLPIVELPVWYDIDDAADLARLVDEIAGVRPCFDRPKAAPSSDPRTAYPTAFAPATRPAPNMRDAQLAPQPMLRIGKERSR